MAGRTDSKRWISTGRFLSAVECPTKLYYAVRPEYGNTKASDPFLRALAKGGFQVGELARWYEGGGTAVDTLEPDEALRRTDELLARENSVVYEAAVRFRQFFVRVDILRRIGDRLELYEVKAKSFKSESEFYLAKAKETEFLQSEWRPYFHGVAFQHWVLRNAFPRATVVPFLYLVDQRTVASVDGLNQKFLVREQGRNVVVIPAPGLTREALGDPILKPVPVLDAVERIQRSPSFWSFDGRTWSFEEGLLALGERHERGERTAPQPTRRCGSCEYRLVTASERALGRSAFDECWSEILPSGTPPREPMVFDLWNLHWGHKDKFLEKKRYLFSDLTVEGIEAPKKREARDRYADGWEDFERRRIQLRKVNTGDDSREVLEGPLRDVLQSWTFPYHFIDFETTRVALPFFAGGRPYEQVAFQFSHHVVHEDGRVEHRTDWIHRERGTFPNFHFVRALRDALSRDAGTIFRYASHENTVLCEIAQQLEASQEPDRKELVAWIRTVTAKKASSGSKEYVWRGEREMVDLLEVVRRYYFHPRMGGSNSIKAVLPAILHDSAHLQAKYGRPIYGTPGGIPSRNFTALEWDHRWVTRDAEGRLVDPYVLLKGLSGRIGRYDYEELERLVSDDEITDGGAAMIAYAMMQFTEMSDGERQRLTSSLLRYCELDTLAMVMLYEYWCEITGLTERLHCPP